MQQAGWEVKPIDWALNDHAHTIPVLNMDLTDAVQVEKNTKAHP